MEIILKREAFSNTLQNINSVVDKSTTKPILSNFVIRTIEGNNRDVEFSSTDYELSLVELVPAEIKEQGSICVKQKKYLILSGNCRQKDFPIRPTEQLWIHITWELQKPSPSGEGFGLYPQTVLEELPQSITITVDDLRRSIE
ncbi:MAG: hypothetical protein Ct9H300mP28_17090 [Pseudomonadota bacterium]|nr:MAG: hypothetical protein Ct9H300mP28_17090 [Pseudomonadota bacterium]